MKASLFITATLLAALPAAQAQTSTPGRLMVVQACQGPYKLQTGQTVVVGYYLTPLQVEQARQSQRRYELDMLGALSGLTAGYANPPPRAPYVERYFESAACPGTIIVEGQ